MRNHINPNDLWRYFWAVIFASIISLIPTLAAAADSLSASTSASVFTPAPLDQSILYLEELFGNMPPVLVGTGSQLMAQLFKVFNTAVLTLGIVIAGYTTFVGILNTAGEGEMLGKSWNSLWIPLRTVAGIGLLIPTASGYCVCQVFMMWVLVQGIGAADSLTGTIVNYMESSMKVFVPSSSVMTGTNNTDPMGNKYGYEDSQAWKNKDYGTSASTYYDGTITAVYQGLSCMQAYQKACPQINPDYMAPTSTTSSTGITYNFIAHQLKNSATCTAETIDTGSNTETISCGAMVIPIDSADPNTQIYATSIQQGFNAIIPSLNSAAYFMVNDPSSDKSVGMQDTFNFVGGAGFLSEVERVYSSFATQGEYNVEAANTAASDPNSYYEDIRSLGWVTLGAIYWDMAKSKGSASDMKVKEAIIAMTQASSGTANQRGNIAATSNDGTFSSSAWTYGHDWATQFIQDMQASRSSNDGGDYQSAGEQNDPSKIGTNAMAAITMGTLNSMEEKLGGSNNPMVAAQELGHEIALTVEIVSVTLAALVLGLSYLAGTMSSISPATLAFQTGLAILLPGFMIFMGIILVLAGTLSVVIPMIPALAYFFAVIAWLIAALETIVAAPIVAIGVLHPDGQHVMWGKAEPAVMLMTNMFLRPSLIVIGMAAGVILSFITLQFVNFGFNQALLKLLGGKAPTSVEAMLFLTTYVGIVLACVNKSFSTIDAIPEQVMRWISGGESAKLGSGSDSMQKVQQGQEGGAKQVGESTAQGDKAVEKGGKAVDASDEADSKAHAAAQRDIEDNKPAEAGSTSTKEAKAARKADSPLNRMRNRG